MADDFGQILDALSGFAKSHGDDKFAIRIMKKMPGVLVATTYLTFRDCSLNHISLVESWVPKLVGGGEYTVSVNHSAPELISKRFSWAIAATGAPFSEPNFAVMQTAGWEGPTQLTSPGPATPATIAPPRPVAAATQIGGTVPLVGGIPATGATQAAMFTQNPDAATALLTVGREETRARESIAQREADLRAKEADLKLKAELNQQKLDFEAKLASLAAKPAAKEGPSIMEVFAAAASALAPIANAMIQSNAEARKEAAAAQQRHTEMMMKQSQDNMTMILKVLEKPTGPDPHLSSMLEMSKSMADSQGAMMTRMVDAMSTVSKTSIAMIETVAELSAPPEGSPVLEAVKEGVKALGSLTGGVNAGARKQIETSKALPATMQQGQPRPPTPQPSPEAIRAAQVRAAHVNQQAAQQQQQHVAVVQQQPAQVVQFPAQQAQASQPQQQAFGEMPDPFDSVPTSTPLDEIQRFIETEHQPVESVAGFILDNFRDPSIRQEIEKADGDLNVLIANRLGTIGMMAHSGYLEVLGAELDKQGSERGLFENDDDDDDDDDAPQDESSEQEAAS